MAAYGGKARKPLGILNFCFRFRSQDSVTTLVKTLRGSWMYECGNDNYSSSICSLVCFTTYLTPSSASSPQSALYGALSQFKISTLVLKVTW